MNDNLGEVTGINKVMRRGQQRQLYSYWSKKMTRLPLNEESAASIQAMLVNFIINKIIYVDMF